MSKPAMEPAASAIYFLAQKHDEWEGENYDGSSVNGGMKALRLFGHIENYVWFRNVDEIIEWTNGGYGTVVIGSVWYASMDDVDSKGFIQLPGTLATPIGGHAYRVNWYDKARGGFLVVNSWGALWGQRKRDGSHTGTAYLSPQSAQRLFFDEEGEVAAPTQIHVKPVR
jgi:hypothetical protein